MTILKVTMIMITVMMKTVNEDDDHKIDVDAMQGGDEDDDDDDDYHKIDVDAIQGGCNEGWCCLITRCTNSSTPT